MENLSWNAPQELAPGDPARDREVPTRVALVRITLALRWHYKAVRPAIVAAAEAWAISP